MKTFRFLCLVTLAATGVALALLGDLLFDQPVTDNDIEMFMRTSEWAKWNPEKLVVTYDDLHEALYKWKSSIHRRWSWLTVDVGAFIFISATTLLVAESLNERRKSNSGS